MVYPLKGLRLSFISENENSEVLSLVYHVFLVYQVTQAWLVELLLSKLYCVVSDYQMKLSADPRKICSSFKD